MDTREIKSDVMFNILKILHRHSDSDHKLTRQEIVEKLGKYYEMYPDPNVVKRNIHELRDHLSDFGYDKDNAYKIKNKEISRKMKDKKTGEEIDNSIHTDFYMEHLFKKGELSLLIDGLLFSKQIDLEQREKLVKKLELLSSKHFKSRVKHISVISDKEAKNQDLFQVIESIDEAIEESKQITFNYNRYIVNEELKDEFLPQLDGDGKLKTYIVNPYQIVATNGRYYLMCNHDRYDNLSYYRLDRITNIEKLDTRRKPIRKIKGLEHGLELAKHMVEQIYMFSGEPERVTLRLKKVIISDFIDWFGSGHHFFDETEEEVSVKVKVNENAMKKWALQYGLYVRVLAPANLVDEIKNDIKIVMNHYDL